MKVTVELGPRSYPIEINAGLLGSVADRVGLLQPSSAFIITHPFLAQRYAPAITQRLAACEIRHQVLLAPPGERSKRLSVVGRLCDALAEARADRKTVLVALGGGVVGDLTGFVAAIYQRGVRFVQTPTTLLAQVDAAIGGKTGVDIPGGKNLVGAIHQPAAVLIDPETLATLPARHLRSGLAEVVKYGFILDADFLKTVASTQRELLARRPSALQTIVGRSAELKAQLVSEDEHDTTGSRARLNFGHTVGHAIEKALNYRGLLHGEAISIGMVAAAELGERLGVSPAGTRQEVEAHLRNFNLPISLPPGLMADDLIEAMYRDKKTERGKLNFVLLDSIGSARVAPGIPEGEIRAVLAGLRPS